MLAFVFPAFVSNPGSAAVTPRDSASRPSSLFTRWMGRDGGPLAEADSQADSSTTADAGEIADGRFHEPTDDPRFEFTGAGTGPQSDGETGCEPGESGWAGTAAGDEEVDPDQAPACSPTALRWRVRGLALGVLALLGVLTARLWWLHQIHGEA
ncbi:MAG: hypothetical protein ACKOJF_06695, partial [Planctomycetaceae bacterium]